jgi:hypothetical protein
MQYAGADGDIFLSQGGGKLKTTVAFEVHVVRT